MKKIFITGSNGFIGQNLTSELSKQKIDFAPGTRALYGDISTQNNWKDILLGCDSVVHLAARVHVMNENSNDPISEFRKYNVDATINLALAAKKSGIRKFIYLSSVKVNGEETFESPYSENDIPNPQDPYGISKYEAENKLLELHETNIFEIVIIRPPLVYGIGVKANFQKLFTFVKRDLPLPFGLVKNKRSLVSVLNLVDLIITCLNNNKASGEVFFVSDNHDLSLKELIQLMAKVQRKTSHLLPVPVFLMKFMAYLVGKKSYSDRLFGNLQLNITKSKSLLNWNPPYTFEDTFKNINEKY